MHYYIIGCGGVGGWLAQWVTKVAKRDDLVILVDGDKVEEHNLDRQLFSGRDIGRNKAEALARRLTPGATCPIVVRPRYHIVNTGFFESEGSPDVPIMVLLGVDNNLARIALLYDVDAAALSGRHIMLVAGSNEKQAADGWAWAPNMMPTTADPRNWAPELFTDDGGHAPGASCVGEQARAAKGTAQTATANMIAASLAASLAEFYTVTFPFWELLTPDDPIVPSLPVRHVSAPSRIKTLQVKEITP